MSKDRVKMNLIQQDVFVRAVAPVVVNKDDYLIGSYESLDEVVDDFGIRLVHTRQEYPITPDSVNSYADGTNYRLDSSAAVSRPAPGRNLGDVATLQELFEKSPQDIAAFFASALEKINASKNVVKSDDNGGDSHES